MMPMGLQAINNKEPARGAIHVIKNGNPDAKNSQAVWKQVMRELEGKRIAYTLHETRYPGHAKEIAEDILTATGARTVIAVLGGDGTIHEVVNGIRPFPQAVLVAIPAGSGNDFARGIQGSAKWKDSIALLDGEHNGEKADLGEADCDGRTIHFVNSIGIGLDASICGAVNRSKWKKRFQAIRMGRFIYLYYVLKELFLFKPFTLKAEVDGKYMEFSNVWFMVAANQPYFGGGMKIAPEARGDDHKLHVLIVKDVSPFIFLLVFATVLWGRHTGLRWVNAFTCTSIAVDSEDSSVPVQADGELIGHKACAVKILPGAVNIRTI